MKKDEMEFIRNLWKERNIFIVVLTPILLLPILLTTHSKETQCAYVMLVMAVLWVTEALPIAVTSFLPIVLFPMIGTMTAKEVSSSYVDDTSMLFLGGLMIAAAIEHWNIHKRIALRVLLIFGSEPHWLMLGLMVSTWFLSIWISNTATTAMMMPIANAVAKQLKDASIKQKESDLHEKAISVKMDIVRNGRRGKDYQTFAESNKVSSADIQTSESPLHVTNNEEDQDYIRMSKALSLCIAYSANIGGTASLTGTIPNIVMKGQSDIVFNAYNAESPVNFTTWLQFGFPVSAVLFIFLWIWFLVYFLRCRMLRCCSKKTRAYFTNKVSEMITEEYKSLGPISFGQGAVMGHFLLLGILWITRDLGGVGGWGNLFPYESISDSTPSILITISLFLFPSQRPRLFGNNEHGGSKPLLPWRVAEKTVPWGVIVLLGGGYALAKGSQVSGLSSWLGNQLSLFSSLEPWVMNLIICYSITAATEVTSNAAISTLMMPILAELALTLRVNPLYFMFPGAISASLAFMLPVATPPNAVVFSYGYVRVIDMMAVGLILNIISILLLVAMTESLGDKLFDFHSLPDVFRNTSYATTYTDLYNNSLTTLQLNC